MEVDRARETIATQRPRRLRLGELLHELGARDPSLFEGETDGPPPEPPADRPRPETLTVGELVDTVVDTAASRRTPASSAPS